MSKIKVGVLRGGPSYGYEDSLQTGAYLLNALRSMPDTYEPVDIFISRSGEWHHGGLVVEPQRVLSQTQVVWNAIHGPYGEDGEVQKLLEKLRHPYVGSDVFSSALAFNKDFAKSIYEKHSLPTPIGTTFFQDSLTDEALIQVFQTYIHPVIVKPATGSRGLGVRLAHSFQELKDAVKKTFSHSPKVMVEEYVRGKTSSCTVVERAKGEELYALIPSGRHPVEINKKIEDMAKRAHRALGQRHYSSSDFIITPKGKIYILETNSVPALHDNALLHHSLHTTGWQPQHLADHCIKLALNTLE